MSILAAPVDGASIDQDGSTTGWPGDTSVGGMDTGANRSPGRISTT